jgi:hypothetical protein
MFDSKGVDDPTYIEKDDGVYRRVGTKYVKCCEAIIQDGDIRRQCKAPALQGKVYCGHHGSTHLKKCEKPQYLQHLFQRERQRFKRVGADLLDKVDKYRDDPDLFSLRDDTAYVTALVDVRAEAAAEGVGLEQYRKVESAYHLAKSKLGSPDFIDAFEQIGDLLNERMNEYDASKDVLDLIERRADLVETEQKMMQTKAYTLEADQAFMLIMQLVEVVKTSVRDQEVLTSIQSGINKLLRVYMATEATGDSIQDAEVIETNGIPEST